MKKDIFFWGGGIEKNLHKSFKRKHIYYKYFCTGSFQLFVIKIRDEICGKKSLSNRVNFRDSFAPQNFFLSASAKNGKMFSKSVFFTYVTFETMFWQIKLRPGVPRL
jgi:hypothetical protein